MPKILDCTLRDGGYINDWKFGLENIRSIINRLNDSNIDIIEVGFIEDQPSYDYDPDKAFFTCIEDIKSVLPAQKKCEQFVAMARFGHLDVKNLDYNDGNGIDGIRVTFHIDEVDGVLDYCQVIKDKGYKVYIQPVGTTMYSDEQILKLIKKVNCFQPYAFYVVDTLGVMHQSDILRLFLLVDNNLDPNITRGFHSHNNLQMSFTNAQTLANMQLKNSIIIDSSVDGMGRGAGNLHTELIAEHLNFRYNGNYLIESILQIIDDYMIFARHKYQWGYAIPYYLAAMKNCHPSYATFLINKKTLPVGDIAKILSLIPHDQSELFNKELIKKMYFDYQSNAIDDSNTIALLKDLFIMANRVLIVAPGKSTVNSLSIIQDYITSTNPVVIAVNHIPDDIKIDYLFVSNQKRFEKIKDIPDNIITTSNVLPTPEDRGYVVNYSSLLNELPSVRDNAVLMLVKLLKICGVKWVSFAGFDGYNTDIVGDNYSGSSLETMLDSQTYRSINEGISKYITMMESAIRFEFITTSQFQKGNLSE